MGKAFECRAPVGLRGSIRPRNCPLGGPRTLKGTQQRPARPRAWVSVGRMDGILCGHSLLVDTGVFPRSGCRDQCRVWASEGDPALRSLGRTQDWDYRVIHDVSFLRNHQTVVHSDGPGYTHPPRVPLSPPCHFPSVLLLSLFSAPSDVKGYLVHCASCIFMAVIIACALPSEAQGQEGDTLKPTDTPPASRKATEAEGWGEIRTSRKRPEDKAS